MRRVVSSKFTESLAIHRDLLALMFTLLGLAMTAWLVVAVVSPSSGFVEPSVDPTVRDLFLSSNRAALVPEPIERKVYVLSCILLIPIAFLAVRIATPLSRPFPRPIATAWLGLWGFALFRLFYRSQFVAGVFAPLHSVGGFSVAILLGIGMIVACSGWRRIRCLDWVVVAGLVLSTAYRVFGVRSSTLDGHTDAVIYSVSQVVAGKTLLADLPAQYGLYGEMIAPVFQIGGSVFGPGFGLSVFSFSLMMALIQLAALAALYLAARGLLKNSVFAALSVLTIAWLSSWMPALVDPDWSPYTQYWPLRLIGPALAVWAVSRWLYRPSVMFAVALGAGSALALAWNLDSGIPILGGFIFSGGLATFSGRRRAGSFNLSCVLGFTAGLVGALTLFAIYLRLKAGVPLRWSALIEYQRLFYEAGFNLIPLPRSLHPWLAIIGIYAYGIVSAIKAPRRYRTVISFLSVMGLGLFAYYQGRSHDYVLPMVIWPAILIGFILLDRSVRAYRAGLFSVACLLPVYPVLLFGTLSVGCLIIKAPALLAIARHHLRELSSPGKTQFGESLEFVRGHLGGDHEAVILSRLQGVYYAELGIASAISGPGVSETLLERDLKTMLNQLKSSPVKNLFANLDAGLQLPPDYQPLLETYELVDHTRVWPIKSDRTESEFLDLPSKDGVLGYFRPKTYQ